MTDNHTSAATEHPIEFEYTNWQGRKSIRQAVPKSIRFGKSEWHPVPQWLMLAYDIDKQEDREFAMADMQFDEGFLPGIDLKGALDVAQPASTRSVMREIGEVVDPVREMLRRMLAEHGDDHYHTCPADNDSGPCECFAGHLHADAKAVLEAALAAQPPAAPVEKSGIMQAAAKAAEKVAGWSPSKREYADRIVGGECSSADNELADRIEDALKRHRAAEPGDMARTYTELSCVLFGHVQPIIDGLRGSGAQTSRRVRTWDSDGPFARLPYPGGIENETLHAYPVVTHDR